ncbi:hypothetical protein BDR06DRAFT_1007676 [Suillus hirtellus]|nr:hypothetical protein BDR06DRAFT_1007676 [Suillus hirtellus]
MDTDHRLDESVHPHESEVGDPREPIRPDPHDHVRPDPRDHVRPDPRDHIRPDPRDHVRPDPHDYAHHDYRNAPFSGSHGRLLPDPRGPTHWDAPHPLDRHSPLPNPHERLSQEPHDLCVLGRSTRESSYPPQDYHHLRPHDSFYHRTGNVHDDLPKLQDTRGSMRDVSPVAESSTTYNMDRERSRPLGYSDHDRYSPAVEYGYMREHRFPPRDDYNDHGHGPMEEDIKETQGGLHAAHTIVQLPARTLSQQSIPLMRLLPLDHCPLISFYTCPALLPSK